MGFAAASAPSAGAVIQVVRSVVGELEPDQLESVDPVAEAWLTGDLDKRRPSSSPGGGAVGSGIAAYLLAELLFPIVAGAFGDVLGTVALEPRRLWHKKKPAAAQVTPGPPLEALTEQQAEKLYAACLRHAQAMGISAARAAVLADAILGSMARR